MRRAELAVLFAGALVCAVGCNSWTTPVAASDSGGGSNGGSGGDGGATDLTYPPDPTGLHVVGNEIIDAAGDVLVLHGVNRSGTEYECVNGAGIFDGPFDEASIATMTTWHINAVRVPLNETCWLGINGVATRLSGQIYKSAILAYVNLLHKYHLTPILELHWTAAGTALAKDTQQPMPDADHASAFWSDVATTFLNDGGVVFELFNEPFPDSNRDTDAAWACWRDGCLADTAGAAAGNSPLFQAVGMRDLVMAVRATGATQLILLGGVEYSNGLSQWFSHAPVDPANNLAPAWHIYNYNGCRDAACWDSVLTEPTALGTQLPIVVTEIGEDDCQAAFIEPLMELLDAHGNGYLAWSWNSNARPCIPASQGNSGNPYQLITDYTTGAPNGDYAQGFMAHLAAISP